MHFLLFSLLQFFDFPAYLNFIFYIFFLPLIGAMIASTNSGSILYFLIKNIIISSTISISNSNSIILLITGTIWAKAILLYFSSFSLPLLSLLLSFRSSICLLKEISLPIN